MIYKLKKFLYDFLYRENRKVRTIGFVLIILILLFGISKCRLNINADYEDDMLKIQRQQFILELIDISNSKNQNILFNNLEIIYFSMTGNELKRFEIFIDNENDIIFKLYGIGNNMNFKLVDLIDLVGEFSFFTMFDYNYHENNKITDITNKEFLVYLIVFQVIGFSIKQIRRIS